MGSLIVSFQLAGAVALLLFALGLVRDGVTEAFGVRLRMALGLGTQTAPRAFISGLVATLGLQSSTATALMTASFVERDLIRGRMAQVALLGANVGTALTTWIVSAGIEAVAPVLVLAGHVLGRRQGRGWSGTGQALIGVGLILLSVTLLEQATLPLRNSPELAAFLPTLNAARPVALVFAAVIAALCSSSLAAVVLILSLALPPGLTVVLVLGANLGGALPAVIATSGSSPAARRVTTGNLIVRAIGCIAVLPFADAAAGALELLPLGTGLAVEAHLAFNLALTVLIWPFTGMISAVTRRMLPAKAAAAEDGPRWLDEDALATPMIALAGASREVLQVGDVIRRMLTQTRAAFRSNDPAPLSEVATLEEQVDRRTQEVKIYLSRLGRDASEEDRQRSITIIDYVINLEHVGDVIDKNLVPAVRKKTSLGLWLSNEGYTEIDTMFLRTLEILRMAQTVFLTRDPATARQLIEEKVDIRYLERDSAQRHLIRLRDGQPEARETSSLHLDMLRDLKRINAHLVSVAHPILDKEGLLFESRLRAR